MNYHRYKETELVSLAAGGDKEAVAELLLVRYRDSLVSAARNINSKYSDDDIDDALQNFTERNIKPDTNGNWRLRGISAEHNPLAYLTRSFKNYLRDEFRKDKLDIVSQSPEEGRTGDTDEDFRPAARPEPIDDVYDELHPKTQKELQIAALFEALTNTGELSPKERYILATFLLGERYRGNGARPLKIREEISRQLGENASTVYNKYSDLKHLLSRKAGDYLKKLKDI